jgi:hypothetical protein
MKFSSFSVSVLAASLALAAPAVAIAQDTTPAAATTGDSEEELDEAFKRFGYLAGLAQVCVAEEQKPALEREVLDLNNSLARLFGVDRAFLFSVSFGYGTSVEVATENCAEVLSTYKARVVKHRAASGEIK